MTLTIAALSAAYATLGVLLLVMAMRTRFAWWIKAGTIIVTSAFFIIAFEETRGLLGWPSVRPLPDRFQLLWTRVVEPSRAYNEPGAIYLWVEELDDNNVPSGVPRAYKIRYTEPLAQKAEKAREQIIAGKPQEGQSSDMEAGGESQQTAQATPGATPPDAEATPQSGNPIDAEFLQSTPRSLDFAPLPMPLLPVKPGN
jgi:hypothetical protein